jgi:hypothetical protein
VWSGNLNAFRSDGVQFIQFTEWWLVYSPIHYCVQAVNELSSLDLFDLDNIQELHALRQATLYQNIDLMP